nr:forkhead box Q2 [Misgurnus anguillicaudatus]
MEDKNASRSVREQLGLQFTIDYLLYNKGRDTDNVEPEDRSPPSFQATSDEKRKGTLSEQDHGKSSEERTEEKPTQSYIALISMAILDSEEKKLLLCDIYQWIMDHYPYFKSKEKNWRNSIRHNLSLNECFIKVGRSDNGKGHFWAIHPGNYQDFSKGDYHRRRARKRIRRVMGRLPFSAPAHYLKQTPCWCYPTPSHPLMCFSPRVYGSWGAEFITQHPFIYSYD